MPWTIPNQLLHDKPVPLANMPTRGRRHVFVCCSNPGCHHNAELDVSRFPDDVTFNGLQPRMLAEYDSSKEKHWRQRKLIRDE